MKTQQTWQRITELFEQALERPREERAEFLLAACNGGPELLREVQSLLAEHDAEENFLESPAIAAVANDVLADTEGPRIGEQFGRYRIEALIGRGGMGDVFLGSRNDGQFEQHVAIKLLKHGFVGDKTRLRFLQERQILARLEHPAIARLIDGGVTEDGAPFFVMERVQGEPITTYCKHERLGIEQRLRLFLKVCDAVEYAHHNLIVHRDLKPSNILVDDKGHAKLLDFGIAKVLSQENRAATKDATRTMMRAMTPEYAAPEQIRGDPVTTATDVYALGVLLYELLTGEKPYRITRDAPLELERAILEQDPSRPSTRTGSSAEHFGTNSRELRKRLRGDLDRIVLKALEKRPERRYSTPEALANDIRRHLDGLPISARGDTVVYRAGKFVHRHRIGAAAAAFIFLSLVGGLIATTWQARRAQMEARKAEATKNFLKSIFAASDPTQAQGKELTAKQLLDDGARRIETELKDQPDVQSEVARVIATTYQQLGEYDRARTLLMADLERRRKIDGPRSVQVAELLTELGDASYGQGKYDEAAPMYEEALSIQREQLGERSPEVARQLWNIAGVKRNRGDYSTAEQMQNQSLAIFVERRGEDSREANDVRNSLALTYADTERYAEALALQTAVASWYERNYGADHPETINARYNQASSLLALGRAAEAEQMFADIVARFTRVLGARHYKRGRALRMWARSLDELGRSHDALPLINESVRILRDHFGPAHLEAAIGLSWQAIIEAHAPMRSEAERDSRGAFDVLDGLKNVAPRHAAIVKTNCGIVFAAIGKLDYAERNLTEAVALLRSEHLEGASLNRAQSALDEVARRRVQDKE